MADCDYYISISQKPFELESPNSLRTSTPTLSIATPHNDDVIIYFRAEVIWQKLSILPPPTASGGISREWLNLGSRNITQLSRTDSPIYVPDMASPAPSGRLQDAIKYYRKCAKRVRNAENSWLTNRARYGTSLY